MSSDAWKAFVVGRDDLGLLFGFLLPHDRLGRTREGDLQHPLHPRYCAEIEGLFQLVRYLREILGVFVRDDHRLDAGAERRKELLLKPANGEHPASNPDLCGHWSLALL